jgi:ribosomal protein S27AE
VIGIGAGIAVAALLTTHVNKENLRRVDVTTVGGMAFAALTVLAVATIGIDNYNAKRKQCPECGNTVFKMARVCQYCSYRWAPSLNSYGRD